MRNNYRKKALLIFLLSSIFVLFPVQLFAQEPVNYELHGSYDNLQPTSETRSVINLGSETVILGEPQAGELANGQIGIHDLGTGTRSKTLRLPAGISGSWFGHQIVTHPDLDMDSNGSQDVLISAPALLLEGTTCINQTSRCGKVYRLNANEIVGCDDQGGVCELEEEPANFLEAGSAENSFGDSLHLQQIGGTFYLFVGVPSDDKVRIFRVSGSDFIPVSDIDKTSVQAFGFGEAIRDIGDLNGDGRNEIGMSSPSQAMSDCGFNFGALYVYQILAGHQVEPVQVSLLGPEEPVCGPEENDKFGRDMHGYEGRVVVGAPEATAGAAQAGTVHVYNYTGQELVLAHSITPQDVLSPGFAEGLEGGTWQNFYFGEAVRLFDAGEHGQIFHVGASGDSTQDYASGQLVAFRYDPGADPYAQLVNYRPGGEGWEPGMSVDLKYGQFVETGSADIGPDLGYAFTMAPQNTGGDEQHKGYVTLDGIQVEPGDQGIPAQGGAAGMYNVCKLALRGAVDPPGNILFPQGLMTGVRPPVVGEQVNAYVAVPNHPRIVSFAVTLVGQGILDEQDQIPVWGNQYCRWKLEPFLLHQWQSTGFIENGGEGYALPLRPGIRRFGYQFQGGVWNPISTWFTDPNLNPDGYQLYGQTATLYLLAPEGWNPGEPYEGFKVISFFSLSKVFPFMVGDYLPEGGF